MKYVLCYGNEFLEWDSLALEIADEVKIDGIEFVKCRSVDDVLSYKDKDFVVLDVVKGIDKVVLIDNIDKLKNSMSVSLHDYDLGFNLKLLKAMGEIKDVKIIGIPQKGDKEEIKEGVVEILNNV